jgi:hypothetical protein
MEQKKLPRNHAYLHIRNKGYTIKLDFVEMQIPWLEEVLALAMERHNEEDRRE